MERMEILFFLLGLFMTVAAGAVFYFLLYEVPPAAFEKLHTATIGQWEIHYQAVGQGPPLLLIHGIGASLHCWDSLVPLLSKDFQVIALDLPGFGRSSKQVGAQYGLDDQSERIEQFLDYLEIDRCSLVGNSMGGTLALWLAHRHPKRFPNVVAIAPAANPKLVPWLTDKIGFLSGPASWLFLRGIAERFHKSTLANPDKLSARHVTQTLSVYRRNPVAIKSFLAATAAISDPRLLDRTFESRALILWGAHDKLVPRWTIDRLMPRLADATLVIHPNGGHQLQEDDPEWTYQKIIDFLPTRLDEQA